MDAHRMYTEGSVDTAIIKYMFLAELGYEVAQSNVAYLLDTGRTVVDKPCDLQIICPFDQNHFLYNKMKHSVCLEL